MWTVGSPNGTVSWQENNNIREQEKTKRRVDNYGKQGLLCGSTVLSSEETLYKVQSAVFKEDMPHIENKENKEFYPFFWLQDEELKRCSFSEKVFGFIDLKKTGQITFKEFLLGSVHVLKQPLFSRACEFAFTECNNNGTQYISQQELGRSILLAIPNLNKDEVHELFMLFDCDRDGRISKDDFMVCLRQNPLLISLFSPQLDLSSSEVGDETTEEIV